MLQLSSMLFNRPVLSLRIGKQIATTLMPIINPNNLKIEGFYCQETKSRKQLVLLSQDVRDILPQGIIVNDIEALSEPDELVRLRDTLRLHFELLGKPVITNAKEKIGKISDFSFDVSALYIQKLYVSQPFFKNLGGGNLGVDRSQIIEITNKAIVINDLQQKVPAGARAIA